MTIVYREVKLRMIAYYSVVTGCMQVIHSTLSRLSVSAEMICCCCFWCCCCSYWVMVHLLQMTNPPSSKWKPLRNSLSNYYVYKNTIMSPSGAREQGPLLWRRPVASYCSIQHQQFSWPNQQSSNIIVNLHVLYA